MYQDRIKIAQEYLIKKLKLDAFLVTDAYNIEYLTGISSFSHEEREARILMTKKNILLLTDSRYLGTVKKIAPFIMLIINTNEKPFADLLSRSIQDKNYKKIGFDKNSLSVEELLNLKSSFRKFNIKPKALIPHSDFLEKLRMKKDKIEVKKIRASCQFTDKTFKYILTQIKGGVSEKELAIKIELFIKRSGASLAFPSIVAFGENSAIPHHQPTDKKLSKKDGFVLFDLGVKLDGYCSDMSRTVFFTEPTQKQIKIYTTVLEAQEKAIEYLQGHRKKDFKSDSVHKIAIKHIQKNTLPPTPHAIGHGVGLQVHEMPTLSPYTNTSFESGMVVTIEPGIYLPKFGGVRIEDVVLLTDKGVEILTKSTKKLTVI